MFDSTRKRLLIVGESGEHPWAHGAASARLYGWFGVSSYEELDRIAYLANVSTRKGSKDVDPSHLWRIKLMCVVADLVFLVGRRAQETVLKLNKVTDLLVEFDKYVLIPHPSGLNRQLNDGGDAEIENFVRTVLREHGVGGDKVNKICDACGGYGRVLHDPTTGRIVRFDRRLEADDRGLVERVCSACHGRGNVPCDCGEGGE
jgi:hypothetical protein